MVFASGRRPIIPSKSQEALFAYALWYTGKYRVSRARLLEKLELKTQSPDWIEWVMGQIGPYHSDTAEIRSSFEAVIRVGKPLRPLRSKLRAKGFTREDIDLVALEYDDQAGDYTRFEREISRRAHTLFTRGYGPRYVEQDLTSRYPLFKDEIHSLSIAREESELLAEYTELPDTTDIKSLKKLSESLVRRGFSFGAVRRFLQGEE